MLTQQPASTATVPWPSGHAWWCSTCAQPSEAEYSSGELAEASLDGHMTACHPPGSGRVRAFLLHYLPDGRIRSRRITRGNRRWRWAA